MLIAYGDPRRRHEVEPKQNICALLGRPRTERFGILETPDWRAYVSMRSLQRHIPAMADYLERTGSGRIRPHRILQPMFKNEWDDSFYQNALNSLILRLYEVDRGDRPRLRFSFHYPTVRDDPFDEILAEINRAQLIGDSQTIQGLLLVALDLFTALANVLRRPTHGGFGIVGRRILSGYIRTARRFIPLLSMFLAPEYGGEPIYNLLDAIYDLSGKKVRAISSLVQGLNLQERGYLRLHCCQEAANGAFLADDILNMGI